MCPLVGSRGRCEWRAALPPLANRGILSGPGRCSVSARGKRGSTVSSDISGYFSFCTARVGSNGSAGGGPECFVGRSSTDRTSGRKVWDADPSDGIDSGWVGLIATVSVAGGTNALQLQVQGASPSPMTCAADAADPLQSVKLRAGVDGAGKRVSYRSIVVKFYTNTTDTSPAETQSIDPSSAPIASTWGEIDPIDAEMMIDVVPDGNGPFRKIVVSSEVRFETETNDVPSPDSMFADMFTFTTA
jgi:hypothetical protein